MEDGKIKLKDGRFLGFAQYGDLKGKPLFYFHGYPSSRLQGKATDNTAKKLGVHIISVDRPGYGLSDFKLNRSLLSWPDDIIELADFLKIDKFAVAGVSGGGPYAAVCAYKIQNRLTRVGIIVGLSPIKKDLLEGTPALIKFSWLNYGKSLYLRKASAMFAYLVNKYSPSLGLYKLFIAKSDRKILSDPTVSKSIKRVRDEAFKQGYKAAEMDLKIYSSRWGFDIKDIKTPVYLWYGDMDKNVSVEMGKYYASHIKNSKLVIYPNEGHSVSKTHMVEIVKTLTS